MDWVCRWERVSEGVLVLDGLAGIVHDAWFTPEIIT